MVRGIFSDLGDALGSVEAADVLITGSADGTARAWSFSTGNCTKIFKVYYRETSLLRKYSPRNPLVGLVVLFQGHYGAITTMSTDAAGKVLYTASADATIKSWNILTGQVIKVRKTTAV